VAAAVVLGILLDLKYRYARLYSIFGNFPEKGSAKWVKSSPKPNKFVVKEE